jgi:hypothetical protein
MDSRHGSRAEGEEGRDGLGKGVSEASRQGLGKAASEDGWGCLDKAASEEGREGSGGGRQRKLERLGWSGGWEVVRQPPPFGTVPEPPLTPFGNPSHPVAFANR